MVGRDFPPSGDSGIKRSVRVLFDFLHPTHVHIFKNLIGELRSRGHEVKVTMREKDVARELLDQFEIPYEVISRQRSGAGLGLEFFERGLKLWSKVSEFEPHFLVGAMGPTIAPIGRLRRLLGKQKPRVVVFYDTEMAKLTNSFVYPLADYVCTADCYSAEVNGNHLTYPSYQQLAYLHPKRFVPDAELVRSFGIDPDAPYFMVRFVSYEASHDLGVSGISPETKLSLVRRLAEHGRVLVSSERPVPAELDEYAFRMPASKMHHVLAFARLLVGESATMASEAACLGVPAVYVSPHGRGYTDEQERRYGLVHNFTGPRYSEDWVSAAVSLAADSEAIARAKAAREQLLRDKIDVTSWMMELLEREYEIHFATPRG